MVRSHPTMKEINDESSNIPIHPSGCKEHVMRYSLYRPSRSFYYIVKLDQIEWHLAGFVALASKLGSPPNVMHIYHTDISILEDELMLC